MSAVLALCAVAGTAQSQIHRLPLSGGADGTTLQHFGDGLATLLSRSLEGVQVPYTASAGSQENLLRIAGDQPGFAIVHAGDLYRSTAGTISGKEPSSPTAPTALTLSHLYGITAHLLTLRDSPIRSTRDLKARRIAVGQAGSAAASTARHYFEATGLWGRFEPQFMTASQGATALLAGRVDALWLFEEVPSPTAIRLATQVPLRLVPLGDSPGFEPLASGHPYYTPSSIPGGIYPGIDHTTDTFQESVLWVVSRGVPEGIVAQSLEALYSESGLAFMQTVSETATELRLETGLLGVVTPLHPEAERFWRDSGLK